MSLDMTGHVNGVFTSFSVTRHNKTSGYRDSATGLWVDGTEVDTVHVANVQPASMREVDSLSEGGERLKDVRNMWINDGTTASVSEADEWTFDGQRWRCLALDNRYWRNYCKVTVSRLDVQS